MKPGGGSGLLSQGSGASGLLNSAGGAANLGPAAPSSGGGSGFATSLNLETLLAAGSNQNINVPDAETVDKVHFVVNNLSTQNMTEKAAEVTSRISPEQFGWFAVYLVVKRASIEPNFHVLYLGLLDAIGDETLFRLVLDASYSNIKALLSSNKVKTNSGERSLLKNLGSWLGNLTISRNQPVLMRDLDLKALVLESYQTGHMIAVIPFVAKVLEPAKDSIIFKPPNPWTAAVLGLLKEIYSERDLKLNLKFEMERLFKHLEVEIKDQKPSYLLHQVRRDRVNNPDFVADKNSAVDSRGGLGAMAGSGGSLGSMTGVGTPYEPAAMGSPNPGIGAPGPGPSGGHGISRGDAFAQQGGLSGGLSGADDAAAGGLQQHIKIAPAPNLPEATRVALARLTPVALTAAVREIVSPVVERSVTIACMTARELVLKDFAVEPDGARLRKAAHLMVSSLAGSLALVTCREPLKASVATQRARCSKPAPCPRATAPPRRRWSTPCRPPPPTTSSWAARSSNRRPPSAPCARWTSSSHPPPRRAGSIGRSTAPRGRPSSTRHTCRAASRARCPSRCARGRGTSRPARSASTMTSPTCPARRRRHRVRRPRAPTANRARARRTCRAGRRRRLRRAPTPGSRRRRPARRAARPAAAAARRPARARRRGRSRLRPLRAGPHAPRVRAARRGVRVGPGRELRAPSGDARGARRRGRARGGGGGGARRGRRRRRRRRRRAKVFARVRALSGSRRRRRSAAAALTARRLRRTAHAAALAALCQRSRGAARQVAGWLVYAEDDRALDKAFCESLVRAGCLSDPESMRELDAHLASLIADAGGNDKERAAKAATCGAYLAQHCLLVEPCLVAGDLEATLDALAAFAGAAAAPPGSPSWWSARARARRRRSPAPVFDRPRTPRVCAIWFRSTSTSGRASPSSPPATPPSRRSSRRWRSASCSSRIRASGSRASSSSGDDALSRVRPRARAGSRTRSHPRGLFRCHADFEIGERIVERHAKDTKEKPVVRCRGRGRAPDRVPVPPRRDLAGKAPGALCGVGARRASGARGTRGHAGRARRDVRSPAVPPFDFRVDGGDARPGRGARCFTSPGVGFVRGRALGASAVARAGIRVRGSSSSRTGASYRGCSPTASAPGGPRCAGCSSPHSRFWSRS